MKNVVLTAIIDKLIDDFNSYSELVSLNYAQRKEQTLDEGTLQWNRGMLNRTEEYLKELTDVTGVKLEWKCGVHSFGYDDWKRTLEYITVRKADV